MGRKIDLDRPLSAEDRAYLEARSRHGEIAANDRQFGHLSDDEREGVTAQAEADQEYDAAEAKAFAAAQARDEEESFPDHLVEKVAPLGTSELRAALRKRKLDDSGEKAELQIRLLQYLEEQEKARG